jgi:hypothetical protein
MVTGQQSEVLELAKRIVEICSEEVECTIPLVERKIAGQGASLISGVSQQSAESIVGNK